MRPPSSSRRPGNPSEPHATAWVRWLAAGFLLGMALLTGCSVGTSNVATSETSPITAAKPTASGTVHGGQQPVSGSTVQLWQVGTTGYGIGATPLGSSATTNINGEFTLLFDYSCASTPNGNNTPIYITATGGNPGLAQPTNNSAIYLMAALGPCSSLTQSSFLALNEVTTVASVYALAQFISPNGQIGSYASSQQGLINAFATVNNLVSIQAGKSLATTPNGNGIVPQAKINTLSNILSSCINSSGPTSTGCSALFTAATPPSGTAPSNTLSTALSIALNPGNNTAALLNLAPPAAPYQPNVSTANDWTLAIGYATGGSAPKSLAVDGSGNVWVANFGTGGTTSSLSLVSPTGVPATNSPFSNATAVNGAAALAVDAKNNIWLANHDNSSAAEFNATVSGASSTITAVGAPLTAIGLNSPSAVAVDNANNIWFVNSGNASVTQLPATGCSTTTCVTNYTGNGLSSPASIALDASGNAWVANNSGSSVTRLIPGGTSGSYSGGGLTNPSGLAIDGYSNVWVTDSSLTQLSELNSNGAPLSPSSGITGAGLSGANAVAIDGNGSIWVADTAANQLSQLTSTGTAITGTTGYQGDSLSAPVALSIDAAGNIWLANSNPTQSSGLTLTVSEFIGLASPSITPLAQAVQTGQLGQMPGAPAVAKGPVANLSGPYSGISGTPVNFSAIYSSDPKDEPLAYTWNFGDGSGGSGLTPSHSYFTQGTYNVSLTVTNADGKSATSASSATIAGAAVTPPTANAGGPYSGTAYTPVRFNGLSSTDPTNLVSAAQALTYSWNFGDGTQGSGPNPLHTYTTSGTFTVSLTVQSVNTGATATATGTAVIASGTQTSGAPTANPGGPYTAAAGASIAFSSAGSSDPNNLALTYVWSFGDGNSSTSQNPTYTYAGAGSYSVTLQVSNGTSVTSASTSATVTAAPVAPMIASAGGPYTVAVNQPLNFSSAGTTDPSSRQLIYTWDFGDGNTSSGSSPTHIYAKQGSYTVNLNVNDGATENANATASVTVTGPPAETITASAGGPYQNVTGQPIVFSAAGSSDNLGNALTYAWNFGDGTTGTGVTPTHTYSTVGSFTVSVVASSTTASASASTTVPINAPITVAITSPSANTVFGVTTISVSGTVSSSTATVTVNGIPATVSGNTFTATGISLREGSNLISANATDNNGGIGSAALPVILDVTAPLISITSPAAGATVSASSIAVAGLVSDSVTSTLGTNSISVTVNGQAAQVSNKSYLFSNLQLVPGPNTLTVVATDSVGNTSQISEVVNLLPATSQLSIVKLSGDGQSGTVQSVLPQPLVVQLVSASGSPVAGRPITFTVTRSDGVVEVLPSTSQALSVTTDATGKASVLFKLGSRTGLGINQVSATTPGAAASAIFTETTTNSTPTQIHIVRGDTQRGLLGEPLPIAMQVVVMDAYGNPVPSVTVNYTSNGASDGSIDNPAPVTDGAGEALANLTLGQQEGTNNYVVSADFTGDTGSPVTFIASAFAPGPIANTSVSGTVLDNTQTPVQNATVTLAGTGLTTFTNASGNFTINGAPVGTVTLSVDGSTATSPNTLPFLSFVLQDLPGVNNTIGKPIYLPIIDINDAQTVGGSDPVTLTMANVPGVAFTVAPNSVTFPDGSTVGKLSLSQVKSDLVPMEPNDGTGPNVVYTLQPAGTKFSVPVQMTIPNTQGLAPGLVTDIYQWDHDLEQFVSIGTGHVSADGSVINSDPGFGVTKAGWDHCCTPTVPKICGISCKSTNQCVISYVSNCACATRNAPTGTACGTLTQSQQQCTEPGFCANGRCASIPKPDGTKCTGSLFCSLPYQCANGECKGTPVPDQTVPSTAQIVTSGLTASINLISDKVKAIPEAFHLPASITFNISPTASTVLTCCEATRTPNVPINHAGVKGSLGFSTPPLIPIIGTVPLGIIVPLIGPEGVTVALNGSIDPALDLAQNFCTNTFCAGGSVTLNIGGTVSLVLGVENVAQVVSSGSTGITGTIGYDCNGFNGSAGFKGVQLTVTGVLLGVFNWSPPAFDLIPPYTTPMFGPVPVN